MAAAFDRVALSSSPIMNCIDSWNYYILRSDALVGGFQTYVLLLVFDSLINSNEKIEMCVNLSRTVT